MVKACADTHNYCLRIKTANCCFPASVCAYDKEPVFKENLLVFESKFYLIGEGHKEFLADIPVPDRNTTEKDKEEAFLDALLTPAPNKEEAQTQNPTQGPAAKSRPSEPTSSQREKAARGISDPTERSRPSVRQEMKEIREEQRQRASSAQKTKDEPGRTSEHKPVPKKKKDKER